MDQPTKFEEWAIMELFGHVRMAGLVSEQSIGGSTFVRVDVPEDAEKMKFTRYYGANAIYSITPVSKAVAVEMAKGLNQAPVTRYDLPALAALNQPAASNSPMRKSMTRDLRND